MLARIANKPFVLTALCLAGGFALSAFVNREPAEATAAEQAAKDAAAERFFEMRTYIAHDGKFEDLHKRFREHTNRLFQKHGMTLIGYWTPVADAKGEITPEARRTLVYILAYPNREAREKSWKDFMADPDWQAAYKESHKNGPLVEKVISQCLSPTDYSPIK